jgi:hypothetical protein
MADEARSEVAMSAASDSASLVRFTPDSGHKNAGPEPPLSANNGLEQMQQN